MTDSRTDIGWQVDPKPSPPELAEGYEPNRDPFLVPVIEKLDQASLDVLSRILGGWPVGPDV